MSAIANAFPVGNFLIARGIFPVPPNLLAGPSRGRLVTTRKRRCGVTYSLQTECMEVGRREVVVVVEAAVVVMLMAVMGSVVVADGWGGN